MGEADLTQFYIEVSRDEECALACFACSWSSDDFPDDLAGLVALAEAHRCAVVIEGQPASAPATVPSGLLTGGRP